MRFLIEENVDRRELLCDERSLSEIRRELSVKSEEETERELLRFTVGEDVDWRERLFDIRASSKILTDVDLRAGFA